MENEVVVDTCFLEKITGEGKHIEDMKRILETLNFKPVVHPYMAEHELSVKSYLKELTDSGYIRTVSWDEFLADDYDKSIYEQYIYEFHEELRQYLICTNRKKQIQSLNRQSVEKYGTIFTYRSGGSSLGDVHMILMAVFMELPIILTEDSDIQALRSISERKFDTDSYKLEIIDSVGLLKLLAGDDSSTISRKELAALMKQIGERKRSREVLEVWDALHK